MSNGGVIADSLLALWQQFEPPAVLMIVDQQGHIQEFRFATLGELVSLQRVAERALARPDQFSNLRVENSAAEERA